MKFLKTLLLTAFVCFNFQSCGIYKLNDSNIDPAIKTFEVRFFQNEAAIVEPGIDRRFTLQLQDLIQNQTNLTLTNNNANLVYEGEIIEYYIAPQSSTSQNTAAQNRLTIAVNVRFYNNYLTDGTDDFERRFSFFSDVDAQTQLVGSALDGALEEIYERITQDIFTASLSNW